MIKLFNVTFVTIGFTLTVITLIILTIHSTKISMILGIVFSVAAKFVYSLFPIPFNSMKSNKNFSMCVSNFRNNNKPVKTLSNESFLLLKASENLKLLVNQFNNTSPEDNTDPENVVKSKYYDIDELQNMKIPNKDKSLVALFHINTFSLNKNFDDFQPLLSCQIKILT